MHVVDNYSDSASGESQPTQLLQDVLGGGIVASHHQNENNESISTKNISSESFPSSHSSSSSHQYHYHGLADTQTETQIEVDEGSQKENIVSPLNSSKSQRPHVDQAGHPPLHLSPKKPSESAPFRATSPTGASHRNIFPSKPFATHPTHRQHLESQDSFAGDISQDPERAFLAQASQFDIPLSKLGRVSTSVESQSYPTTGKAASDMFVPFRSSIGGRILVAATPSNSVSSQSQESPPLDEQSQHDLSDDPDSFSHRQPEVTDFDVVDLQSQHSTQPDDNTEPSSSYERLLAGIPDPVEPPQVEYEATQPSTQVEEPGFSSNHINGWPNEGDANSPNGASNASNAPRGLLGMVDKRKRWRFDRYPAPGPSKFSSTRPEEITAHVETQPSEDPPEPVSPFIYLPTMDAKGPADFAKAGPSKKIPLQRRSAVVAAMEVVPDSEPTHEGASNPASDSPESRRAPVPVSPKKHSALQNHPIHHDGEERDDRVPNRITNPGDDLEDDGDGEPDIPLAAALKRGIVDEGSTAHTPASRMAISPKNLLPTTTARPQAQIRAPSPTGSMARTSKRKGSMPPPAKINTGYSRSWETGEVPSSVPEQDKSTTTPDLRKGKATSAARAPNKSTTAKTTGKYGRGLKRRHVSTDSEDVDDLELLADDDIANTAYGTKLEDQEDDDMDVELDEEVLPSRKRKRAINSAKIKSELAVPAKTRRLGTGTPSATSIKRLRSVASASTTRASNEAATRVFALWKQDGHYYAGTVHSMNSKSQYLVHFDDDTEALVDITKMRRCELKVGDDVIIIESNQKAKIADPRQGESDGMIIVDGRVGAQSKKQRIQISGIRIATRTVATQWRDRAVDLDSIIPMIKPRSFKLSPSTSKLSLVSTESAASSRPKSLSKTGLVITLSVGNENWEEEKNRVFSEIKENGGIVLDDWSSVFLMDGKHTNSNKRWIAHSEDVKWCGTEDLDRVFLLADDMNQKPKYLIALALGIPCLSLSWLRDVAKNPDVDWQAYLLPQGFSDALDARVSQFVDLDWCNSVDHLTNIMSNRVTSRVFANKSILCLGVDLVPLHKSKKSNTEAYKAKEASRMVPRIILAMGAARVEAAHDIKSASQRLHAYDFVVIKDASDYRAELKSVDACVHVPWVKDCLIAGRLLSLPQW